MLISLGNDHAGVEVKKNIEKYLNEKGIKTINRGYDGEESVDYPDYVHKVAADVDEKKAVEISTNLKIQTLKLKKGVGALI